MAQLPLVLASSSEYRKTLLRKLGLPFDVHVPNVDETRLESETPAQLVTRLAQSKAKAVAVVMARQQTDALIIGCDQVAVLGASIVGKPADHDDAVQQLTAASGKEVTLVTGLCLYNARTHHLQQAVETYTVRFRALTLAQIERYLEKDQPYRCAGSLKAESLGIALLQSLRGNDPNTLIGLPLIKLVNMLANEGLHPV